jgi:hypothetical protein
MVTETTAKSIHTLIEDIYKVLKEGVDLSDDQAEEFGKRMGKLIQSRLSKKDERKGTLRLSNLGKKDRQLWYEVHDYPKEEFTGSTFLKFLYGDIIEELVLFLAEAAGHGVEGRQGQVNVDGIIGHRDAIIDGLLVDVKSTSSYSFKKFKDGTLKDDDPFGYLTQLSGYIADPEYDRDHGAFLAVDKQNGTLALLHVPDSELPDVADRVAHLKEVVKQEDPPPRCFEPEPMGKSGNMKLSTGCSYCPFKVTCWSDANDGQGLRKFIYSTGPVWLTHVVDPPKVMEIEP